MDPRNANTAAATYACLAVTALMAGHVTEAGLYALLALFAALHGGGPHPPPHA